MSIIFTQIVLGNIQHDGNETFDSALAISKLPIETPRSPSLIVPDVINDATEMGLKNEITQDFNSLSSVQSSPSLIIPDYLSTSLNGHRSPIAEGENNKIKTELKLEEVNDWNRLEQGN